MDDEDFKQVNAFSWHAQKVVLSSKTVWYAVRKVKLRSKSEVKVLTVYMHRQIMGVCGVKNQVDHRNGNTLDNRKENLRAATNSQNQQNRQKAAGCSSRFKGVSAYRHKWRAYIQLNGRRTHLGYFGTEEEAAETYARTALKVFGEFACI